MDIRKEAMTDGPVITGFAGRGFRVGDRQFPGGLLISPDDVIDWTPPEHVSLLDMAHLGDLCDRTPLPEFLLLGTGARLERPTMAFVRALEAKGIGVEAMDSRAAARAWSVLRMEQRQIVGALMPLLG